MSRPWQSGGRGVNKGTFITYRFTGKTTISDPFTYTVTDGFGHYVKRMVTITAR